MPFLEHDLKTLLDDLREPFLPSETKTLLHQILSGVNYLHAHWILHRDLKTSNLLLSNRGEIKIADFGMARYFGDPPPKLTQLVVTLWYRAPELLLGAERYGAEVDMWSVGCIFGELLTKSPLFQGRNEVDQVSKVCSLFIWLNRRKTYTDVLPRYSPLLAPQLPRPGRTSAPYPMPSPYTSRQLPSPPTRETRRYSPGPNSRTSQTQACIFSRLCWR